MIIQIASHAKVRPDSLCTGTLPRAQINSQIKVLKYVDIFGLLSQLETQCNMMVLQHSTAEMTKQRSEAWDATKIMNVTCHCRVGLARAWYCRDVGWCGQGDQGRG